LSSSPTPLPPHADQVVISVNPKAGAKSSRDRVQALAALLEKEHLMPHVLTDLDEVGNRANRLHAEGRLRALVGVGGDGTAAELTNRTTPGTPLTLLPSGNENLLARYLGLGKSPEELCRTIAEGSIRHLDAGSANGRVFLLMTGCGFDADVVHRVHVNRTGHIRSRNYAKPILSAIRSYEYPAIRVYLDESGTTDLGATGVSPVPPEEHWRDASGTQGHRQDAGATALEVRWLFVFNLPCYGGGLRLAPQADGSDGLLDVCGFRRGSLWHGLRYAAAVALGQHQRLADCTTARVRRLRITSDAEVRYQLDGDPGGVLPLEIEVLPGRLTMVVPAKSEI
jgi:diacylglycerol kinase (ATP)